MKFAKQYSAAYQDLPPEWPVIEYKALKKSIRKIVQELEDTGILVNPPSAEATSPVTPFTPETPAGSQSPGARFCTVDYFLSTSEDGQEVEPFIVIKLADEEEEEEEEEMENMELDGNEDAASTHGSVLVSSTAHDGGDEWRDADIDNGGSAGSSAVPALGGTPTLGSPARLRKVSPAQNGSSPSPHIKKGGTPHMTPRSSPRSSPRVLIRVTSLPSVDSNINDENDMAFEPLPSSLLSSNVPANGNESPASPTLPHPLRAFSTFTISGKDAPASPTMSHPLRFSIFRSSSPEPSDRIKDITDGDSLSDKSSTKSSSKSSTHSKSRKRKESDDRSDRSVPIFGRNSSDSGSDSDSKNQSASTPTAGSRKFFVKKSALHRKRPSFTVVNDANDEAEVKLTLKMDHKFFQELAASVNAVAEFEKQKKAAFEDKLEELSKALTEASSPYGKDMYAWRNILAAYMDSEIWLVDHAKDRPVAGSRNMLQEFGKRVSENRMDSKLKGRSSQKALECFFEVNQELLRVRQFDEINHTAVYKILKKHDKRTLLTASSSFPMLSSHTFFTNNLARMLVFTVCERLQTVVPQVDDFACPICQDVTWKPIRLECQHVFCVRCLVKAQLRKVKNCPVCRRENAVEKACADNLDVARMNFLKLYFPREVKQKTDDSSRERAEEDYGRLVKAGECVVM
ncbi:hypothetical protein HDV00_010285 [Rhizophlyctis rosea]|nr:hypothetical protein HDV00_010285 [Rhizophlyctis rosea]